MIFYKELHRDVCQHLVYYTSDLIVAVEASKQGVTVGEDTVSGLMFADDFVGTSETPEGLQKQIKKALLIEYRECRSPRWFEWSTSNSTCV